MCENSFCAKFQFLSQLLSFSRKLFFLLYVNKDHCFSIIQRAFSLHSFNCTDTLTKRGNRSTYFLKCFWSIKHLCKMSCLWVLILTNTFFLSSLSLLKLQTTSQWNLHNIRLWCAIAGPSSAKISLLSSRAPESWDNMKIHANMCTKWSTSHANSLRCSCGS